MNEHRLIVKAQQGATLIEILVSILVISLGILAMVVMQLNTTKFSKTSEYQAMGALLASDLGDRMRANNKLNPGETAAASYAYTQTYPPTETPTPGTGCDSPTAAVCTPQQIANKDIADWRTSVFNSLPQGDAYIAPNGTGDVDIWLIWIEPNSAAENNTTTETGTTTTLTCPATVAPASTTAPAPRCMHFRITV